jgi:hypothetical protein
MEKEQAADPWVKVGIRAAAPNPLDKRWNKTRLLTPG